MTELKLMGIIDENLASNIIDSLFHAHSNNLHDIRLYISSLGGAIMPAVAIYNFVKSHNIKITTVNLATVESSALLVYLCGTKRIAENDSKFMIHPPALNVNEQITFSKANEIAASLSHDTEIISSIFKSSTGNSKEKFDIDTCLTNKTCYLTKNEAFKYGIVTEL